MRVFWLAALGAIVPAAAQADGELDFDRVEVLRAGEDVLALAQTADGFLWVGTAGGLYRHDGHELKAISEVPRRRVSALLSTGAILWVALDDPAEVLRLSGGWTSWARPALPVERVQALGAAEGAVWIAGKEGLFRLDPSRGFVKGPAVEGEIQVLQAARAGGLWVGTSLAIGRVRDAKWEPVWRGGNVRALYEAPDRLIASADLAEHTYRLLTLDPSSAPPRVQRPGPDVRARALAARGADGIWVGTRRGLVRMEKGVLLPERAQLPNHEVNALLPDQEGNLWLATTLGLARVPRARPFRTVATDPGEVVSVRTMSDGAVLMLLDPDTLVRWKNEGPLETLSQGGGPHGMIGVVEGPGGTAWVGSWQEGLFRSGGGALAPVALRGWESGDTVRPLLWSRQRGLVLAVGAGKLAVGAPGSPRWIDLRGLGVGSEIVAGLEDCQGRLWLATEHDGLVEELAGQDRFARRGEGWRSRNLTTLAPASDGGLWIGTRDSGLFHLRDGRVTAVGRARELGSASVTGIVPDGRDSLWITTAGDGLVRVQEAALLALVADENAAIDPLVLTTRDGLPTDGTAGRSPPAGGLDRAGRLWLATYRGAVVFPRPWSLSPALPPLPTLRIDSVRVDGHPIALPGPGEARLAMGRGELQVRYTAVLFEGRERLRFRHRLEGFDRGWRDAGDAQEIDYTGLPAGRYRFRVAPYFAGATAVGPETVFAFALIPPFHRTRLFFAGMTLLLAGAVALGWRMRVRLVRRRLALIAHERNRIAREIHDSLEQTLYAAKLQLEVAGGQPARRGPHLTRGIELVERAIDEARAAVWALRTGVFGRADLSVAISVTAGDSLRHSPVAFALETEGTPFKIAAVTQWHIGQTVRESFTNALKHGKPSKVTVRLVYGPTLVVSVIDDGVGLAAPVDGDSSGHYGLQGMRERLRACGGTVTLDSPAGGGTTVRIEVPREVPS